MPLFTYRARNINGGLIKGEIEAIDERAAMEALSGKRLYPLSATEQRQEVALNKLLTERKPKPRDLANMVRQFQLMFTVGMPMDHIFNTLIKQARHKGLQKVLDGIKKNIGSGLGLSQSFRQYPLYFNHLFVSMVEAGEIGGVLGKTLTELSSILEKEHWLKSKLKSAMLYPKLVVGALVIVTSIVLIFVIPPFEALYKQLGSELPLPTKILMATSKLLIGYWYLAIIFGIVAFLAFRAFAKSAIGRWAIGYVLFRVPVFGPLNIMTENARFCHLMSALYKSGLPFAYAITVTANTVSNVCFAKELYSLKDQVNHGSSLSKGLDSAKYFTPMVREMCVVGEQTGKIDETLQSTALFYDDEIDDTVKNMSTLLEPVLLVLMFGLVLILALAVYLPIWNLSSAILHKKG